MALGCYGPGGTSSPLKVNRSHCTKFRFPACVWRAKAAMISGSVWPVVFAQAAEYLSSCPGSEEKYGRNDKGSRISTMYWRSR